MKRIFIFSCLCFLLNGYLTAQTIKVNYITTVPKAIQQCGAMYTYDTTSLNKKKYIMLADFQNVGMIRVNGKLISLQLKDSKLSDKKMNVANYTGGGYRRFGGQEPRRRFGTSTFIPVKPTAARQLVIIEAFILGKLVRTGTQAKRKMVKASAVGKDAEQRRSE